MRNLLADLLFPHYCSACGRIGALLCERCKYDIISEGYGSCLVCRLPVPSTEALCKSCHMPYSRAWCVAAHDGSVKQLIADLKFERTRAAAETLAELLADTLPRLPSDVTVVPVPTIASHIRQRGYDHAYLIALAVAKRKQLPCVKALERQASTTQRGSGRKARIAQAAQAFMVRRPISGTVLLIDDVFTTGATMEYAAKKLREAGADDVWAAVVSREPLD